MTDLVASERAISFGPFRLVPTQRLLLEDDNPVRVGSRALDILTALVERPGELVGKEELMARVWRGTFVEDGKSQIPSQRLAASVGRWTRRQAVHRDVCGPGLSICRPGQRRTEACCRTTAGRIDETKS